MKFLNRLLAKPKPKRIYSDRLSGAGTYDIELESLSIKNLDVIWKATSNEWRRKDESRDFFQRQTDAMLVSDVENRVPNAIRVEISGKVVGHLGLSDALRLHRRLKELEYGLIRSACKAKIVGRPGHWQVDLDYDPGL